MFSVVKGTYISPHSTTFLHFFRFFLQKLDIFCRRSTVLEYVSMADSQRCFVCGFGCGAMCLNIGVRLQNEHYVIK